MAGERERDAAIRSLVRRIREETKRRVPDVDPDGPGGSGRVLILLSDPGEGGALRTGYLSPIKNSDPTAKNQARLMREARSTLKEIIALLPNLRAVVAAGNVAQDVCHRAGVDAINICHPSNRGLSGGVKGARLLREKEYRDGLRQAAMLAMS